MSLPSYSNYNLPKQLPQTSYMAGNTSSDKPFPSTSKELLINWVNSLEYPNCLLASELHEFRNGVIFCEIVNEIILKNSKPDFLPKIKQHNPNTNDILDNFQMALSEIKAINNYEVPREILQLKGVDLTTDDNKILLLLDFLYNYANSSAYKNSLSDPNRGVDRSTDFTQDHHYNDKFQWNDSFPVMNSINSTMPSATYNSSMKMSQKPPLNPANNKLRSPNGSIYKRQDKSASNVKDLSQINPNDSTLNMGSATKNREFFSPSDPLKGFLNSASPIAGFDYGKTNQDNQFYSFEQEPKSYGRQPSPYGYGQEINYSGIMVNDFMDPDINTLPQPKPIGAESPDPTKYFSLSQNFENINSNYDNLKQAANAMIAALNSELERPRNASERKTPPVAEPRTVSPRPMSTTYDRPPSSIDYQHQGHFATDESETRIISSDMHHRNNYRRQEKENIPDQSNMRLEHLAASSEERDELAQSRKSKKNSKSDAMRQEIAKVASSSAHKDMPRQIRKDRSYSVDRTERKEKKEEIVITPVTSELKEKILNWLFDLTLIKDNVKGLDKKLPKICKNGLIFVDLINRLESKHDTIKGINRNPKNKSYVNSNYHKVMEYLKGFEKMNPRYLFAQEYLVDGNEDVFWGFLDDIWHLYNKKISPHDPRYQKRDKEITARGSTSRRFMKTDTTKLETSNLGDKSARTNAEISYTDIIYDRSKITAGAPSRDSNSPIPQTKKGTGLSYLENSAFSKQTTAKELRFDASINKEILGPVKEKNDEKPPIPKNHSYSNLYNKKGQYHENVTPSAKTTKKMDFANASPMVNKKDVQKSYATERENVISVEQESEIMEWLKHLGLKSMLYRKCDTLFADPFRNGTLLCLVVGRVLNEKLNGYYPEPKSIDECRFNIYKAFNILRQKKVAIPNYFWGKEESYLVGERNLVYGLLYSLLKIYGEKRDGFQDPTHSMSRTFNHDVSSVYPPYSKADFERLENSLLEWLSSLGVFIELPSIPTDFKELIVHMKNGVILCELTVIVTKQKIPTIYKKAQSENHCLSNIRKALDVLRSQKMMSQKYLWKEKEIYSGDRYIIVGLLEDIRRFYDGLGPRKNPNYFFDGPYIPELKKKEDIRVNNFEQEKRSNQGSRAASKDSVVSKTSNQGILKGPIPTPPQQKDEPIPTSFLVPKGLPPLGKTDNKDKFSSILNLSSDEPISIMDFNRKKRLSVGSEIMKSEETYLGDSVKFDEDPTTKTPLFIRSSPKNKTPSMSNKHVQFSPRIVQNDDADRTVQSLLSKDKDIEFQLKEWIAALGFGPMIRDIDLTQGTIEEFKDGIFLCKIIEKLEMKEIPGVIMKPKTNASRLVNIKKALNTLAKQPGVNPHMLYIEDKILAGDGETIRQLLLNIKNAYRFISKCIMKTTSTISSRVLEATDEENKKQRSAQKWDFYRPEENYTLTPQERKKMIVPPKYAQ